MPYYDAPSTDLKRQLFLQRAAHTAAEDLAAGNPYLNASTMDALDDLSVQFVASYHQLAVRRTERMAAVETGKLALDTLQARLRDFWQALRRRARRLGQPVSVLGLYQLPGDGSQPNPTRRDGWIALGDAAVEGEGLAQTAGYPPMANPAISEVQTALLALKIQVLRIVNADRNYDRTQEAVAALRPPVDLLIKRVMAELRVSLVGLDEPSFRRVARRYGAEFKPYPGEEPQNELVEAPIPEPAPEGALLAEAAATG
ncbi:MAG: hypothetical protein JW862_06490 [Anaerolineales bacterium]|nr:hypothetical protein [Anaerolineales bacterium]